MSSDLLAQLQKLSGKDSTTMWLSCSDHIAKSLGAIDRHKSETSTTSTRPPQRSHKYINPQYNAKPISYQSRTTFARTPLERSSARGKKEVVIGGVEFESSKNKLTRKGAPTIAKPALHPPTLAPSWSKQKPFANSLHETRRQGYKTRGNRRKGANMTLNNVERSRKEAARARKAAKQCPFFCKTGLCGRGKKCFYQHDPKKVAICPRFMRRDCPYDGDQCLLSHDSTPERVSLCVHFANTGLCKNGADCLYPHFNVGPKSGVCRDFAVLGYCEKGIDCDQQHLRECPTFAETGKCKDDKCKLPHVIRANANRKTSATIVKAVPAGGGVNEKPVKYGISFSTMAPESITASSNPMETLADTVALTEPTTSDFISLTFEESDEEEAEDSEEEEEEEEEESNEIDEEETIDDHDLEI